MKTYFETKAKGTSEMANLHRKCTVLCMKSKTLTLKIDDTSLS